MMCQLCKQDHEDIDALPVRAVGKIYFICAKCGQWLAKLLEGA